MFVLAILWAGVLWALLLGLPPRCHARLLPPGQANRQRLHRVIQRQIPSGTSFMSLDDARQKCEAWRRDYNEERPHSAIGNKAPIELIDRSVAYGPP